MPERTLALVGNGPIGRSAAETVDDHDLVVRINRAPLCGAAGRHTDILATLPPAHLSSIARQSQPINPIALAGARELWFMGEPTEADGDAARRLAGARPVRWLGAEWTERARTALRPHQPEGKLTPSTGLILIFALLALMPEAEIVLFGFSHEGSRRHLWSGERIVVEDLIAQGRIRRAPDDGRRPVHLPVAMWMRLQARRAVNHLLAFHF